MHGNINWEYFPPNAAKPDCAIKGNIIQYTNIKEYALPECNRYSSTIVEKYKGEDWFCTEEEAKKAGYSKSPNCK